MARMTHTHTRAYGSYYDSSSYNANSILSSTYDYISCETRNAIFLPSREASRAERAVLWLFNQGDRALLLRLHHVPIRIWSRRKIPDKPRPKENWPSCGRRKARVENVALRHTSSASPLADRRSSIRDDFLVGSIRGNALIAPRDPPAMIMAVMITIA